MRFAAGDRGGKVERPLELAVALLARLLDVVRAHTVDQHLDAANARRVPLGIAVACIDLKPRIARADPSSVAGCEGPRQRQLGIVAIDAEAHVAAREIAG